MSISTYLSIYTRHDTLIDWFWLWGWLINKGAIEINKGAICTRTAPLFWNFISLFQGPRTRSVRKIGSQNQSIDVLSWCFHFGSLLHVFTLHVHCSIGVLTWCVYTSQRSLHVFILACFVTHIALCLSLTMRCASHECCAVTDTHVCGVTLPHVALWLPARCAVILTYVALWFSLLLVVHEKFDRQFCVSLVPYGRLMCVCVCARMCVWVYGIERERERERTLFGEIV